MSRVVWNTAGALLTATVICSSSFAQTTPIEFAGDREPPPPVTESKPPAPSPSTSDPTFRIRGRLQADALAADQTPENKAAFGNLTNVVGFRRARLGAEGTYGQQAAWVSEFDFADGEIRLRDVYLSLIDLPYVRRVRVGHFREPFGFEGQYRATIFRSWNAPSRITSIPLATGVEASSPTTTVNETRLQRACSGPIRTAREPPSVTHRIWPGPAARQAYSSMIEEMKAVASCTLAWRFSYRPGQNTITVNQEARSSLLDRAIAPLCRSSPSWTSRRPVRNCSASNGPQASGLSHSVRSGSPPNRAAFARDRVPGVVTYGRGLPDRRAPRVRPPRWSLQGRRKSCGRSIA